MNKEINQLPDVTSGFSSDTLIPVQLPDGTTGRVLASQVQGGGGSTPPLYSVLEVDNYTNGYDIILNAGSKLKSSNTNGEDSLQMIESYINMGSYDGNFDSTQLYLTPTQTGIRKNNNQTGTPEAEILLDSNGIILRTQPVDNVYNNSITYGNAGENNEELLYSSDGTSYVRKNSVVTSNRARVTTNHYIKGGDGEFAFDKVEDVYGYTSRVTEGSRVTLIDQSSTYVNLTANNITLSKTDGTNLRLFINDLSVHNNNSAALAAGLQVNEVYRKNSGELMIVH
jgi:hypothetical protein